jgi:RES domain-containing protein
MYVYRMHRISSSAFDTTGAFLYSGRWHSAGVRVVYAAQHVSLAALEILIHSSRRPVPDMLVTEIEIPDHTPIERSDWMELERSRQFGDEWIRSGRGAVLRVPSKAVNGLEFNFLINPAHTDSRRIRQAVSHAFAFDRRLFPES